MLPFMRILSPWIALHFLFQLAAIIRNRTREEYKETLMSFLEKTQLQLIALGIQIDTINLNKEFVTKLMVMKEEVTEVLMKEKKTMEDEDVLQPDKFRRPLHQHKVFYSDCVFCVRLKALEDKVQSVFDLLEEVKSQQKYQTETDLKSLVNTDSGIISIDHQALNSNKLKHFL